MADEPLIAYLRPGFPKETLTKESYRTELEYVGLVVDLLTDSPDVSEPWGDYRGLVTEDSIERFEGSDYGILSVTVERKFDTGDTPTTGAMVENETTYEVDWVDVQRSLFEHPEFRIGNAGTYELTADDVESIKKWEVNPDPSYKKDFIYDIAEIGDHAGTLSANAQMLARGIQLGIEYWVDKAPVAIRSDTWVKGPPPSGTAGQKETPTGFPNLPSGYEWIRNSDRALRAGGQSSWTNTTDWIGADKVLIDVDQIFWSAP